MSGTIINAKNPSNVYPRSHRCRQSRSPCCAPRRHRPALRPLASELLGPCTLYTPAPCVCCTAYNQICMEASPSIYIYIYIANPT